MTTTEIIVVADPVAVAHEAAGRFVALSLEGAQSRGRFSVALSGGSTPGLLFELLARDPFRQQVPWDKVYLFWGDERCVPPDDPGSNYRLADERLITHVPIPPGNVHRVLGELEPEQAARTYQNTLADFFHGPHLRFDLVLLGLGQDGHTASLFPDSAALEEDEKLVVSVKAQYQGRPAHRVSLTLPAINAARESMFLVTGESKAEIIGSVLAGKDKGLPAQRIQPLAGKLTWLLDSQAAALLEL